MSKAESQKRCHYKHKPERIANQKRQKEITNNWSEYRTMWTIVMFDMPVATKQDRKNYAIFRKSILELGFEMHQFSVYKKFSPNGERREVLEQNIKTILPPKGKVSILAVTGNQYAKMKTFFGFSPTKPPETPEQSMLF